MARIPGQPVVLWARERTGGKAPVGLSVVMALLAALGAAVVLAAGLARAQESKPPHNTRALVEGLLKETQWQYQYVGSGIFRIPIQEGPDVWVHASGDYVSTRAIVGDLPPQEELTTKQLLELLMANFSLYQGKFGVDEGRTVWFEINMPIRLIAAKAKELDLNILYVARQASKHRISPKKPQE